MRTIEVPLAVNRTESEIDRAVERACDELGLSIWMRGTLATYPGSLHWHLNRPGKRGTLEITYAPRKNRLWLAVHANRNAEWIDQAMAVIAARLADTVNDHRASQRATIDE
jgi:hypothetical protein